MIFVSPADKKIKKKLKKKLKNVGIENRPFGTDQGLSKAVDDNERAFLYLL